jgi:hypothetical protein|tara:strand:- start:1294 stop:1701 length:408 start_codon:yes stop_codon:yes gene_type:complete
MDHEESVSTLLVWLENKGYYVDFDRKGDDSVDTSNKIVSINNTRSLETQLYILLHECGHILIHNNEDIVKYKDVQEKFGEKTKINKVFTVMEEVEAWKRGKSLAKRLNIKINEEKWNKDLSRALYKYILWAAGTL